MRIDVHAHYYPDEYIRCLSDFGAATHQAGRAPGAGVSLEQRVELLDRSGIHLQVLCVGAQQPYFANAEHAAEAARRANDSYADICGGYGGRFAAFAALPMPHLDAALQELSRALDTLGMVGVNVGCTIAGQPLDDACFEPLFAELDRRAAVVFLHPLGLGCGPLVEDYGLSFTLGAPFEDSIAALRLVRSGLTARYPHMRLIVPHLGGTLPFLFKRLDGSLNLEPGQRPSEHLKRMWFDTANNHTAALRCAVESVGASQLVFGTDFPHVAGERFDRATSYIQESDLSQDDKSAILDHNAQALLGIPDR